MILLLFACAGGPAGDTAAVDTADSGCTTSVTWHNFAQGFFRSYCNACHSSTASDRYGAPEGLDFDTEEKVRALESAIRHAVIEQGSMPPGGGLLPEDLVLLGEWLECGG